MNGSTTKWWDGRVATAVSALFLVSFMDHGSWPSASGGFSGDKPWPMHQIDPTPLSGSDGVKLADVNGDGLQDLVTGFEEGGVSRIYIHPGKARVRAHWKYVSLPSPDVEDAVLVDLDDDGVLDLVTASEGNTNQIVFHWGPKARMDYLDSTQWKSEVVPVVDGLSAWMFVVPFDMDGQHGIDLIVGSKRKRGQSAQDEAWVGWLKSPAHPRSVDQWEFFPLTRAGWVMSILPADMNGDGLTDFVVSDRKFSSQTGVRWIENPGRHLKDFYGEWASHMIGVSEGEPMFIDYADLNGDGVHELLVPDCYGGLKILSRRSRVDGEWQTRTIPYPAWTGGRGKAVSVGDMDQDGRPDVVLSFEEEGDVASIPYDEYIKRGKYSVVWGSFASNPLTSVLTFHKISSMKGRKFDLVNLIDMDGDGDPDILTNDENEEGDGLGVVWYENTFR